MALHDAELIQRTLAGDESAFGFLVDKYKGSVHALAYRKLGDFHTAEEITQDTFLKAYQKLSTLKDPGRFPGWLYVIAARCCISWLRRNRLQIESFDNVEREMNSQSWLKYTDARLREEVHNALESLPESERTVLTLYYMAGMTCEEIGRFIGTSCGAIRDRLYRARISLKEELTMIEETLEGFQLPPSLTQEIMRRISDASLDVAPTTSKPLVPWIAATALTVVTLLIGLGLKQATTFQLPYSFNAPESATMVEIVDTPIIEMSVIEFSQVNQAGKVNGGESGNGNQENGSVWVATSDSQNEIQLGEIDWTQTGGPYGGTIMSLHATPEGILFAGTNRGGIFRSTDGGDTWVSANEGLRVYENNMLPVIFALTQKENTLYAGTNDGLFYSVDNGASWQQLAHFPDEMIGISGIAFIGDALYIGRHTEKGVFFSNDNGKSWTQVDSGLTGRLGPRLIARGTTLFAQMWDRVFRLKAGETSWTKLVIKDPSKRDAILDITKFVVSDEVIYAAADRGLFRSTDMGDSWIPIGSEAMQRFYGELAAVGNTVFYIGSGIAGGQVLRSSDAGNSWTTFNTDLTNQSLLSITALSENTLYVGTLSGVFRSTDGGESWTKINTGIINTHIEDLVFFRNALYTVTGGGIVKSADDGNSWVPVNEGLVASEGGMLTVSRGKLYIATNETNYGLNPSTSGIYSLAADGNSWIPVQTNMESTNNRIYVVNQLAISGETFYIVGQMGSREWLYRWRVGEDLWTQLRPQQNLFGWGNLAVSDRTIYISSVRGKLFRSVDEGDTWTEMSQNLPNWDREIGTYDLAFVGDTIYAKAGSGGGRSTDGGETWTPIVVVGLPGGYIEMQLVDGTTLYGTSSHGIFRLIQGSDSWERIAPTQQDITSLTFDGTMFYAGTEAEGVYRLSLEK